MKTTKRWLENIIILVFYLCFVVKTEPDLSVCLAPPNLNNGSSYMVMALQYYMYTCDTANGFGFPSGDVAIDLQCINNQWTPSLPTCEAGLYDSAVDCGNPISPNLTVQQSTTKLFTVYTCSIPTSWYSEETYRYSQCIQGNWTSINDFCVEIGQIPPKDCEDILSSQNSVDGVYSVLPSGVPGGTVYQVYCQNDMSVESYYGGAWSVILKNEAVNMVGTNDSYEYGFFYKNCTWAGTKFLYEISQARTTGIILDIVMSVGGNQYYATYDNFAVGNGSSGYQILSVGNYHGNAGDALRILLGQPFMFSNVASWWQYPYIWRFNGTSFLTSTASYWYPLYSVSKVLMRIRSAPYDQGYMCPVAVAYDPRWNYATLTNVTNDRRPGTVYTYLCFGELMFLRSSWGSITTTGSISCLAGSPPGWNATLKLPCVLICPANYVPSYTARACLNFSTALANGLVDAQLKCESLNASLFHLLDYRDLRMGSSGVKYLTKYALRRRANYNNEPSAWNLRNQMGCSNTYFNCTCPRPYGSDCGTVWNYGFGFSSCSDSNHYICQRTTYCYNIGRGSEPYFNVTGGCYRIISSAAYVDITDFYDTCTNEGSSLAHPTSEAQMNILAQELIPRLLSSFGNRPGGFNVTLGINFQNFYSLPFYEVSPGFATLLQPSDLKRWRLVNLMTDGNYSFISVDYNDSLINPIGLCHYNGFIDCQQMNPPQASDNMTTSIYTNALWSNITYICKPGYAINGNISQSYEQNVTCFGQLGGWIPNSLQPCSLILEKNNVTCSYQNDTTGHEILSCPTEENCNSTPPVILSNMAPMATVTDLSFGVQYNYTCVPGYFVDGMIGLSTQQVACEGTEFGWQPSSLLPCIRVPVCSTSIVYVPPEIKNVTVYADSYYLNGNISYTCQNTTETLQGTTLQNITCVEIANNSYQFSPCLQNCNLCTAPVNVTNATSPWSNATKYYKWNTVAVTCTPEHEFAPGVFAETITCYDFGWWYPYPQGCYHACLKAMPSPGSNVVTLFDGNGKLDAEGAKWLYRCSSGFYYNTTLAFPNVTNVEIVSCDATGNWSNPRENDSLSCISICASDPLPASRNGSMDWNGYSRFYSAIVNYSCHNGYMFTDYTVSKQLTCNGGNWMVYDNVTFTCVKVCETNPPTEPSNCQWNWDNNSRAQGVNVSYTCFGGYLFNGTTASITVSCNGTQWNGYNSETCQKACLGDPPATPTNATSSWDGYSRAVGSNIYYTCISGYLFIGLVSNITVTCNGSTWTEYSNDTFECQKVCTTLPPAAPSNGVNNWNGSTVADVGTNATYSCSVGFMFSDYAAMKIRTCDGYQWRDSNNSDETYSCIPVCVKNPPAAPSHGLMIWNGISRTTGDNATYQCETGYIFRSSIDTITATCNGTQWIGVNNETFDCDKACFSAPPQAPTNGTSNWTGSPITVGNQITYTCSAGYTFLNYANNVSVTCGYVSWSSVNNETFICQEVCETDPPKIPSNATNSWNGVSRATNDSVNYSCLPGYLFAGVVSNITITCNGTDWDGYNQSIFFCEKVCTMDPPTTSNNVTYNWDGVSRSVDDHVTYACPDGFLFGGLQLNLVVSCNGSAWSGFSSDSLTDCKKVCAPPNAPSVNATNWNGQVNTVGNVITYACNAGYVFPGFRSNITINCSNSQWSDFENEKTFYCEKVCQPPSLMINDATTNFNGSLAFLNDSAMYNCNPGYGNFTYNNSGFESLCTDNGWSTINNFQCVKICLQDPPLALPYVSSNFSNNFTEGVVVSYICFGKFESQTGRQQTVMTSTCTNGNWAPQFLPRCLTITTPGPTTSPPIILPESNVSTLYPDTTTRYFGDLTQFNSTSGAANAYSVVNGVIGFGSAISLNKSLSQCMNKSPFATNQSCLTNPGSCTNGLSFSLWTLVLYDDSVYDMTNLSNADSQYFLSTGADQLGHPGVALGVKKQWLFALVSTGSQYWFTQILGQLSNNTWNNVGVRWSPLIGMEVYVNATKVGSTTIVNSATAQPTYSTPTLMIGCQKTASDSNHSGYFNGYCDEIAMWDKVVPLTSNLSLHFLGGYSENTSHISPAEFASMLANIQINNPGQQAAAVKILSQLTASTTLTPPPPTATQTNAATGTAASPTAEAIVTPAPASVKSLKTIGSILMNMMDPTRLPSALSADQADSFLKLSESFSNVLGPDNTANWLVVQNQTETVGVMQLVQQFRAWHSKLMQSITYTNESEPMCNEIVNNNLYIKYCKMTICDFGVLDKRYVVPDYSKPSLQKIRNLWKDTVIDRVAFPTQIFPDDRCCDRPVSFIFHYYGFADQSAVSSGNPMYVTSSAYTAVDARIMNLDIVSDLAYDSSGNVDTKQPLCNYDAEAMTEQQLLYKSSHKDTNEAQIVPRKLLLFENQTVTDIQERLCVYWNENLTDYGAWDSHLCRIVVDTGEYSQCACNNLGIFTILAIKNEPIVVPVEPQWVFLIKYIFYGLSVFAVIVYITVVLLSGELKDQFHLVGMHLAIAILIGSIAMVLSDFDSVKDNRNTCTMVGTVMHIFYGAVGTWILCLGHASFNAITAGIIGGRLLSYSTIAWGVPLAFTGVPFITMITLMGYDPRCFIGWDNIVKWVFFAPQMGCALLATFFAIVILCNLSTPALRKENLIKDYGTFCRGAALLILYLSITWVFGLLTYMKFGLVPNFYPIFQVLNSLSGVGLLVLIGFGSERFRSTLAGKTQARREMLRQFAFGLPNSDDVRKPLKMQSKSPSAASTSNLVPEDSDISSA